MARRRRLEPPGAAVLDTIRAAAAQNDRSAFDLLAAPPIAQLAADSLDAQSREISQLKAAAETNREAAEQWRAAEARGLLLVDIDLAEIDVDYLARDRLPRVEEDDAWRELKASMLAHGQRTPLEVAALDGDGARRYGLISGCRRFSVLQRLYGETGDPRFARARAVVRNRATLGQAFLAMVEENEIRENISFFERGRICILAAQHGACPSVEAALDTLFATASAAKRSKIRSFMRIAEEVGDLLRYPQTLGERLGLRLALALKAGHGGALRRFLGQLPAPFATPADEQAALARFLADQQRPQVSRAQGWREVSRCGEAVMFVRRGPQGFELRVSGPQPSQPVLDAAVLAFAAALDAGAS